MDINKSYTSTEKYYFRPITKLVEIIDSKNKNLIDDTFEKHFKNINLN
jgi:hypothetical protein